MQIASSPTIVSPVAPSAAAPGGAAPAPGENSPFAKLLSAQQQGDTPPSADAAEADPQTPPTARTTAAQRGVARGQGRGAGPREPAGTTVDKSLSAQADPKFDAMHAVDADATDTGDAESDHDVATADPALADWLAALQRPVTAPAGGVAPAGSAAADAPATTDVATGAVPDTRLASPQDPTTARGTVPAIAAPAGPRAEDKAAERIANLSATTADVHATERQAAGSDALVRAARDVERGETRFELPRLVESTAAASASVVHPGTRPETIAATPAIVNLATPVTAPEFREALGVQVSVLARDGVQHAELHLNPAEMGPITVQIALDGTRAQVDFGAESFATRQVIEAGLPELASALRDAGFTLAGGGVSQHSRGQASRDGQPKAGHDGAGQGGDGTPDASGVRRTTVRVPQGAVDLYA